MNTDSANFVLDWLGESADPYDPWGSALSATFDVCDAITLLAGTVPASLDYRPSPLLSRWHIADADDYRAVRELIELVETPDTAIVPGCHPSDPVTVATLERVAAILDARLDAIPLSERY